MMAGQQGPCGNEGTPLRLFHGSDVVIEHPDVTLNTGFADLGRGFYLTDDHAAARRRALARARRTGAPAGVVSVFELDVAGLPWMVMGEQATDSPMTPFGLCFGDDIQGITCWLEYIMACRRGQTAVGTRGEPSIVRAWIATEEVEMVSSGMVSASEMAAYIDPSDLIVQYCLRSQDVADARLSFVGSELLERASKS